VESPSHCLSRPLPPWQAVTADELISVRGDGSCSKVSKYLCQLGDHETEYLKSKTLLKQYTKHKNITTQTVTLQ